MNEGSKLLNLLMKKYGIDNVIILELIKKISSKEKIEIKDLKVLFQIDYGAWYRLKKGQNSFKLKFNQFCSMDKLIGIEKIAYDEFILLLNEFKLKEYTLIRRLGITSYKYNKLKNKEINDVRIKNMQIKHKVDLVKIDLQYLPEYGERYYTHKELEDLCTERNIKLDDFLLYFNNNYKHYKYNKMSVNQNANGFWIGRITKIPDDFINKHYNKMIKRLNIVASRLDYIIDCNSIKEDLVQEVFEQLYEKSGNIIKNFYFDTNLMFNILMKKARYLMIRIYMRDYRENSNIHYDRWNVSI